eukprot:215610_1
MNAKHQSLQKIFTSIFIFVLVVSNAITCNSADSACKFDCKGGQWPGESCRGAILECLSNVPCTVDCDNAYCKGTVVEALTASSLTIIGCYGGNDCQNMDIHCPSTGCFINGHDNALNEGNCGCDTNGMSGLNFFATNSFDDINFSGYVGTLNINTGGTMHCSKGSCRIIASNSHWRCESLADPCNTLPTPSPTNNPTRNPTPNPTPSSSSPTPSPTNMPTPSPTPSPTNVPTKFPTPSPTINPTPSPTAPTNIPTNIPTNTPSKSPSPSPTDIPSVAPSFSPSVAPTNPPSTAPSQVPTFYTMYPSKSPTIEPTTNEPTVEPTSDSPTKFPTKSPTEHEGNVGGETTELYDKENIIVQNESEKTDLGIIIGVILSVIVVIVAFVLFFVYFKKKSSDNKTKKMTIIHSIAAQSPISNVNENEKAMDTLAPGPGDMLIHSTDQEFIVNNDDDDDDDDDDDVMQTINQLTPIGPNGDDEFVVENDDDVITTQ